MLLKKVWSNRIFDAYLLTSESEVKDIYVYFHDKLQFIVEFTDKNYCRIIPVRGTIDRSTVDFAYEVLDHMQ